MTFFEFHSYSRSIEFQDELNWRRESQLLSLMYNVNRGKGKSLTPKDFNPYEQMRRQGGRQEMSAESIEQLKQQILNRNVRD